MRARSGTTTLAGMRWRSLLLAVAALVVVLGTARVVGSERDTPVTEHPVAIPEKPRTVTISATMPLPSAHARRLSAMLEEGAMPRTSMPAEVLTDTDCAPDGQMVSHCRNEMRLRDGSTIVLRHPHDMRKVPCLAPGEQVLLVPETA